ncbi:MAG: hypothetical protein CL581_16985 [Alteromonadaceae bacterium]|nr:hypothetical protein [Alteromonadaceae bacterium]MBH85311.1 hypothetical protein [Alteromonadaceae bacterium]|tara:strand:- start:79191 stop:79757 length:567 start_codon:yes stop_codon:yes gene_type:complete
MYQLVFRGECTPQTDEATARANAMALFKATVDQVDRMFSGQRVVIRNKLDEAQAGKYEAVLRKHGMIAHIEPMEGTAPPPRAASPAPTTPQAPAASESSSQVPVEPGDRLQVAGEKVDAILSGSSLRVEQAHDRLTEERHVDAPMFQHLDEWTLAPAGSTLVEKKEEIPTAVPDISHLSLVSDEGDRE